MKSTPKNTSTLRAKVVTDWHGRMKGTANQGHSKVKGITK